ncbi:MAG: SDR family NAD(P)-dependent oxidoreductase, partial [Dehalococcoidia bacterium]
MQLEGKSALVTGGGRGIGRGIALAYAREGADVAIVGRSRPEPEEVVAEIQALGHRGAVITADLAQGSEAQRAVREAVQSLGKVDILVNNVGGYRLYTDNLVHNLPVAELSEDEWHRVITGNLTTAFLSCKAVLPHMMERRSGVIINLTSHRLAQRGVAGQAAYGAAKAAVERLTESLAEELKEYGVAANILNPGWVLTRPNDDYDAEVHKRMRLPEDIGPAAV